MFPTLLKSMVVLQGKHLGFHDVGMVYSLSCQIVITHSEKHGATKGSVPVMPKPMRVKENRSSILETRFMQSYQSPSFLCYVDPRIGREKLCKNIPMIWPPL
jgi:RNA recognition motif-containing protein